MTCDIFVCFVNVNVHNQIFSAKSHLCYALFVTNGRVLGSWTQYIRVRRALKDLDDNMVVYFSRIDAICIYML